jgi:DNA-binding CsgD family transcriptional regulator
VLHAVLAAYILCFAGGVNLVVVASFTARRFALVSFRDFGLFFAAATLLMIADAIKMYERVVRADFGPGLHIAAAVLSLVGNAGFCWYLAGLALQVVRIEPPAWRIALHGVLAAALGLLGGLKEVPGLFWPEAGSALVLWGLNHVGLLGVNVYAAAILILGFSRIENAWLRSLVRSSLIFFGVFVILAVVQFFVQNIATAPALLHDYPFQELLYYIGFVILAIYYIARFFSQPVPSGPFTLPEEFVIRFGISHRERDIIEMMARGFSNNAIAEKLYISTLTVKNHVYHIYQKTGAANKVQLLNMVNSSK